MEINEVLEKINGMNMDELRKVQDAVGARWDNLTRLTAIQFNIGDKVGFVHPRIGKLNCVIHKVNKKSIVVKNEDDNGMYKVSPQLLTKM
jgi:hypothetical protein